jgi:hypothetical protein
MRLHARNRENETEKSVAIVSMYGGEVKAVQGLSRGRVFVAILASNPAVATEVQVWTTAITG